MHLINKQTMRYVIILMAFFFIQCANKQEVSKASDYSSYDIAVDDKSEIEVPRTAESSESLRESTKPQESKIIKSGILKIEVSDIKKAKSHIDKLLKEMNAYYESENFFVYTHRNQYNLKIRVPVNKFDTLVSTLEMGEGELISKNISAKDVTEKFVDLNIRIKSKKAYLNQYKEILKKAKTIREILEVQEKIRRLEVEIESKEGQLLYLENNVKYSTLNVELTEPIVVKKSKNSYFAKIENAFKNGFDLLLGFVLVVINIWPFLLMFLIVIIFRKRIIRSVKK